MELLFLLGAATVAMVMLEFYFVKSFPRFGRWIIHNPARALIFSLVLSFMLTVVFPAAGMIVMVASVTSTICMRPIYLLWRQVDRYQAWKAAKGQRQLLKQIPTAQLQALVDDTTTS